jgi:hypothetical protein
MDLLRRRALKFGPPMSLHVDRASIFSINPRDVHAVKSKYDMKRFERACQEVDIEVIHACSPEAKACRAQIRHPPEAPALPLSYEPVPERRGGQRAHRQRPLGQAQLEARQSPLYAMDWHRTAKGLSLDGVLSIQRDRTVNQVIIISARKAVRILQNISKRTPGLGVRAWGTRAVGEINVRAPVAVEAKKWEDISQRILINGVADIISAVNRKKTELVFNPEV